MGCELGTLGVRLTEEAGRAGCLVRLLGGVGVLERCRVGLAAAPELTRVPNDIDVVGLRRERGRLEGCFKSLGLSPDREFNVLGGGDRLLYTLMREGDEPVRVDVVLDRLEMCHVLQLAPRLGRHPVTISATDLLLSKLQVMWPSERDVKDTLAMLATFDLRPTDEEQDYVEVDYIRQLCGSDWGWCHTVTINLGRVKEWAEVIRDRNRRGAVCGRACALGEAVLECPKTLRWRFRSVVGERVRWYQIPEEAVVA